MSVYDRVQHVMIPNHDGIDPEQQAWIGEVADVCSEFCKSIGMEDEAHIPTVSLVLQTAAETLWFQTRGKPNWSRLNVDEHLSALDVQMFASPGLHQVAVDTLSVFYGWLAETKRIRHGKAMRKIRQLRRHRRTGVVDSGVGATSAHAPN